MKSTEKTYQAYLVRLWRDGQHGDWRASAQDTKGAKAHRFANVTALIAFLEEQTTDTSVARTEPTLPEPTPMESASTLIGLEMPVSLPQAQPQWAHRFSAQPVDERAPTPDPPSLWASFVNQVAEFLTRLSGPSLRTAMVGSLVALLALVVVQFAQINPAELMGTVAAQPTGAVVITIAPPTGLTDVVTITTSNGHSLALKYDGTVVAWGDNSQEQATVPAGLTDVIAIAAGDRHSLALKRDGTVVAWGNNDYGQSNVPAGLREVTAIAAGRFHSLALKRNGTVVTWGNEPPGQFQLPGASATIP